jgi:hypothetical protein
MTGDPPPRARLPASPPSPRDLAERERYADLVAQSLSTARASAQAWRNGLAAFITLITTGVVVTGHSMIADVRADWRLAITLLIAVGLGLAVLGLWQALTAEAGTGIRMQTLEEIRADYLTLDAYQVSLAADAARRLQRARYAVGAALACILAASVLTWWAPLQSTPAPNPKAAALAAWPGMTPMKDQGFLFHPR